MCLILGNVARVLFLYEPCVTRSEERKCLHTSPKCLHTSPKCLHTSPKSLHKSRKCLHTSRKFLPKFLQETVAYIRKTSLAIAQPVLLQATGRTVRGSNPGGGTEIFRKYPERPWGPPSLLYNGYRVFPGGKEQLGRDADHPFPSVTEVKERVELYLYFPSGFPSVTEVKERVELYSTSPLDCRL